MISKLYLKNFIAFTDLSIDFSPGINIVIGENGTGKTQLLKAILALSGAEAHGAQTDEQLARKLCRLYHPLSGQVGGLRRAGTRGKSVLKGTFASEQVVTAKFYGKDTAAKVTATSGDAPAPAIFIPTKEVLSLVRGLTAEQPDLPTIERIFDDGYLDLANHLAKEGRSDLDAKVQLDPRFASIVPRLTNLIDGQYLLENGRFVFEAGRYVEKDAATRSKAQHAQMYQDSTEWKFVPSSKQHLSSGMTAEGFRKIGVLQRLLSNGSLNPGITGPLLWDEPESNLNPKLMKDLVQVLLELARNGQQIILATHDYVLLKWFDLLMDKGKGDQVAFHRLYRDSGSDDVQRESQSDYAIVARSAISSAFAELYDEDVKRALGSD
ncbi:DNA replication and repair protein RecF [Achromobacter aegrifaciens]|uniref:AAA family ATPase n=1 Tax=Achromobacter aegrifaciens TaxID=1287736 RepID=UPI0014696A82|nr:AAA family ATPase [Achromobacter aegrifaciens]CAB3821477.1 DNA replication and repair protein RecF [Achromobacter aegrifaciens]